jgi:choline dehydrogenase-like flavoprotein
MNTTSQPEEYDLLVLGSGEAGKFLGWTLARKGMKAAVVERKDIGGLVPQHRLPTQQECHPECQGRLALPAKRGIRNHEGQLENRHDSRAGAQAQDGLRPG